MLAGHALFWAIPSLFIGQSPTSSPPELIVSAGARDRMDSIVRVDWAEDRAQAVLRGSSAEIVGLEDQSTHEIRLAQVDRFEDAKSRRRVRLTWIVPGDLKAGDERSYRVVDNGVAAKGPWSIDSEAGVLLKHGDRTVFRYNSTLISDPTFPHPNQPRNAYIHPAFTPSGALVTGDYSKRSHPHHRGFFLAYTKTNVGDLHPDFWNIQAGSGKVHFDRLGEVAVGAVTARFTTHHRWEAAGTDGKTVEVLRERWEVEAFDVPGSPYWLIDLTSTQRAVGRPMVLPPYRYGGMAYRGPDSFLPKGVLDVLTSSGLDRVAGDQEPARWVDLTGPVAEGSADYAGAALLDHPDNPHHPTPARIHPTTIPFVCFTPSHDREVVIGTEEDTVFRYRIVIHDGRPDATLNERLWGDFAEPVGVRLDERD